MRHTLIATVLAVLLCPAVARSGPGPAPMQPATMSPQPVGPAALSHASTAPSAAPGAEATASAHRPLSSSPPAHVRVERQESDDDWRDQDGGKRSRDRDEDDEEDEGDADSDLKASSVLGGIGAPMWIAGTSLFALHPPIMQVQYDNMGSRGGTLVIPTPAAVGLNVAGLIFATASWSKARDAYNRRRGADFSSAGAVTALIVGIVGTVISVATIASSGIRGGYELPHAGPTVLGAGLCLTAGLILSLDGARLRAAAGD